MRLVVRLLGAEVFAIETGPEASDDDAGECTTQPIGFVRSEGDQRWLSGVDFQ